MEGHWNFLRCERFKTKIISYGVEYMDIFWNNTSEKRNNLWKRKHFLTLQIQIVQPQVSQAVNI